MTIYSVEVYNNMGHLQTIPDYEELPKDISQFVYTKTENKILYARDKEGMGARFYILKPELEKSWSYMYNGHTIHIDYSKLDTFDENVMVLFQV